MSESAAPTSSVVVPGKGKNNKARPTITAPTAQTPGVQVAPASSAVALPYDTHGEVASSPVTQGSSVFISNIRRLRLMMAYEETGTDGVTKYRPFSVLFDSETFTTDDPVMIDAMRKHPNYGGSLEKRFEDRSPYAREPLFWEGDFPRDIKAQRDKERSELSRDPEDFERGAQ